ncbi:hypothetical protein C8Q70DRAFT_153197 [Cubamyces menziesii]|nr:hypothetical protein C8Q70DRAFT_153197 [Cubamyces menziesii]
MPLVRAVLHLHVIFAYALTRAYSATTVSCLALVILDMTETLSDEVALMWPSRFTAMKTIYFVNRYIPLIEIALTVIFLEPQSLKVCKGWWTTLAVLYLTSCCTSEGILFVRTLALWQFSRVVLGILIALASAIIVACIVIFSHFFQVIRYPTTELLTKTGCVVVISGDVSTLWMWIYGLIMLSETVVVVLTLLQKYMTRATVTNRDLPPLLHTMYRDGTLFYVILLLVTVAAVLCINIAPKEVSSLLQMFHQAVHSTLTSRVLLNLRAAAVRSSDLSLDDFLVSTPIAFETPGVPLHPGWDDEYDPNEWPEAGLELDVPTVGGGHMAGPHMYWPSQSDDNMGEATMSHAVGDHS